MPFPMLVPSTGGGGGIAEYDTWADLPSSPTDGAEAVVGNTLAVALDGHWLPAALVEGRTLTLNTSLSFGLEEAAADLTAGGWTLTSAAKTTGNPLAINGVSTASMAQAVFPARYMVRMEYAVSAGQGWILVADNTPTRRADYQYSATEVRRANSSSISLRGPFSSTGPLFFLFDWTAPTPAVAWWAPGMDYLGVEGAEVLTPSSLEAFSNASYDDKFTILGGYPSSSATYTISDFRVWGIS